MLLSFVSYQNVRWVTFRPLNGTYPGDYWTAKTTDWPCFNRPNFTDRAALVYALLL